MNGAEELYRQIDLATIDSFKRENRAEDIHLDFKAPRGKDDAKKPLARALSGFANADGGVIVWGVDAKHRYARELKPISDVKGFRAELEDLTGQAVNPVVDGVLHKEIEMSPGANEGYVKTLVPASDSTPHMAKLGEDRYYKRNGSSFLRMEHFDLEDMFGWRPRPKLDLHLDLRRGSGVVSGGTRYAECRVIMEIANTGRRYAGAPYLVVRVNKEYQGVVWGGVPGDAICNTARTRRAGPPIPGEFRFAGGPDLIIHPEGSLEVAEVKRSMREGEADLPDLRVEFTIWALDMRPASGIKVIPGKHILGCAASALAEPWP